MSALRPLVELHRMEKRPGPALTDGNVSLDWESLDAQLDAAVALLHGLDTGPRGRVAVMAHNSVETVVAHAAIILAGLSAVPISFHLTPNEVAYLLEVSEASVLLVGPETADVAHAAVEQVEADVRVIGWRTKLAETGESWEHSVPGIGSFADTSRLRPRAPLMFTSGTTGRPKPVEQPPNTFPRVDTVGELLASFRENPLVEFSPHLVVGPLYHTGPLTAVRLLLAGTSLVVLPRFDAEAALRAVQERQIKASVMVPTHFSRLLALPETVRASYDVSSLQQVVHTGAACPVAVKREILDWWGPILVEAYGGTEVGTTNSIDTEEWLSHPGSVGRAVPPYEVIVLDDDGHEAPTGTDGQLCFRDTTGRGLVYAIDGVEPASSLGPGLFTLGEVGHVDAEGYVYITDRTADLVVSGGVNVYPAEVERVLMAYPGVEDVAAFGVPHPEMGEELRALVTLTDPRLQPADLLAHCRTELAGYKCPRSVKIVAELPRTAMGKLDKRALRDEYGAGVAVSGS